MQRTCHAAFDKIAKLVEWQITLYNKTQTKFCFYKNHH